MGYVHRERQRKLLLQVNTHWVRDFTNSTVNPLTA